MTERQKDRKRFNSNGNALGCSINYDNKLEKFDFDFTYVVLVFNRSQAQLVDSLLSNSD